MMIANPLSMASQHVDASAEAGATALRRIRAGLIVLNILAVLLCAAALRWRWQDTIELSKLQATNTAALLARGAAATLDKVALALAGIDDQIEQAFRSGGIDPRSVWPMVDKATSRVPELQTIGLFDRLGQQICGVSEGRCRHLSVADRDYFARFRADPASPPELFGPMLSRLDGRPALILASGLQSADGGFSGVAIALLPLENLNSLVRTASLGPNGVASLRIAGRFDVLARAPELPPDKYTGQASALAAQQLVDAIANSPDSGVFRAQSGVDGVTRINAYRKLAGYPIYAFVGDAIDDSLADWRTSMWWTVGFLLAFSALSVVMERVAAKSRRLQVEAQRLYDQAPCGYHTLDARGRYLTANATELDWLGCTRTDLIGKLAPTDFFTEEGRAIFEANFPKLLAGHPLVDLEMDLVARDGSVRRVAVNASPVFDANGQFVSSNSVMHDITALHEARRRLLEQNTQQQAMLNTDLVGILVVESGQIVWKNAGMDRIFGYSGEDWAEMAVSKLYPNPQAFADVRQRIAKKLASDGALRRQVELRRKDGSLVWVDVFAVRLAPSRTFSILTDMTPIKRAEEARLRAAELEVQNQALIESARLKDQFLANMSHELRTPLNAVIGFSQLLQMGSTAKDDAKHAMYVRQIGESGQHLLGLVQTMLDFAKAEAGKLTFNPRPIQIRSALEEVANILLAKQSRTGVAIDVEVAAGLDTVLNDPLRLRQMVLNLVGNAVKFSHAGGRVSLRARAVDSSTWCVEVEDHGIGIKSEDLDRLFKTFVQLSEGSTKAYGGTGLGLALVRQIARAQGGDVTVRSEFGVGSVFTLTLPLAIESTPHRARA